MFPLACSPYWSNVFYQPNTKAHMTPKLCEDPWSLTSTSSRHLAFPKCRRAHPILGSGCPLDVETSAGRAQMPCCPMFRMFSCPERDAVCYFWEHKRLLSSNLSCRSTFKLDALVELSTLTWNCPTVSQRLLSLRQPLMHETVGQKSARIWTGNWDTPNYQLYIHDHPWIQKGPEQYAKTCSSKVTRLRDCRTPAAFAQVAVPRTFAGKVFKATTYSGMFRLDIYNHLQYNTTQWNTINFAFNILQPIFISGTSHLLAAHAQVPDRPFKPRAKWDTPVRWQWHQAVCVQHEVCILLLINNLFTWLNHTYGYMTAPHSHDVLAIVILD